jgi:hypothetical protein
MYDLFLSYTSYDRLWAERLYNDLRRRFPTLKVFWDQDRKALPLGDAFRPALVDAVRSSTHFVVLWSEKAKASNEVGPEIQAFDQHRQLVPLLNNAKKRTLFYVPLDASEYGPLEDVQALVEMRKAQVYDPSAQVPDRGVGKLSADPQRTYWERIVRDVGTAILASSATEAVTLAVVAMNDEMASELDQFLHKRLIGPTLQDLLGAYGLALADVKTRYHQSAFDWQPFGTEQTVVDLMEEIRVEANARLKGQREYWFHWDPWDLLETVRGAGSHPELRDSLGRLGDRPFALVVDPITLHHPLSSEVFKNLGPYTKKDQSVCLALAPTWQPTIGTIYECLNSRGAPALDEFFLPGIPAAGPLWGCGLNVQHPMEIERLIRGGLGALHRERFRAKQKPLIAVGDSQ